MMPRLFRLLPLTLPLAPVLVFGVWRLAGLSGESVAEKLDVPLANTAAYFRERDDILLLKESEASQKAQQVVRDQLLPPDAVAHFPSANFSDIPGSHSYGSDAPGKVVTPMSVVRRKPYLYCVRGTVQWRTADGAIRKRRFEADVRNGPIGGAWTLVDTEFLPTPPE